MLPPNKRYLMSKSKQGCSSGHCVQNLVIPKPPLQLQMNELVNESGHEEHVLLESHGLKSKENFCGEDKQTAQSFLRCFFYYYYCCFWC